jgi:hypothetical protein
MEAVSKDERTLVQELCGTVPPKLPDARGITKHTIDGLSENKRVGIPPCQSDVAR